MLIPEQVNRLITSRAPKAICDACIVAELNLSSHAHAAQITASLGTTSDFDRSKGFCRFCGQHRVIICATKASPSDPTSDAL